MLTINRMWVKGRHGGCVRSAADPVPACSHDSVFRFSFTFAHQFLSSLSCTPAPVKY